MGGPAGRPGITAHERPGVTAKVAPTVAGMPRVEIAGVAPPLVNHALAPTGVGFLRRVVVTFPDVVGPVEDVTVRAEVRDARGEVLTRPWQHRCDAVPGGAPLVIDEPPLRLDP